MTSRGLTLKVFLLIVANDAVESLAQLLMKKGLSLSFWLVGLGILIYALNFLIWIVILSRVELSVASPVGSTGYVTIPLLAAFFLNERIGFLRGGGILLIAWGVHLVSKSTHD